MPNRQWLPVFVMSHSSLPAKQEETNPVAWIICVCTVVVNANYRSIEFRGHEVKADLPSKSLA